MVSAGRRPTLYAMIGLPGAGKTTRARELEASGAVRLSPDDWMLPLFGDMDAARERDVVEGQLITLASRLLVLGISVVLDFGFWSREERGAMRALGGALGCNVELVYLPIDDEEQRRRLLGRSDATAPPAFTFTEEDLVEYRTMFMEPQAWELEEPGVPDVPAPFSSWGQWAEQRWEGLRWPAVAGG